MYDGFTWALSRWIGTEFTLIALNVNVTTGYLKFLSFWAIVLQVLGISPLQRNKLKLMGHFVEPNKRLDPI